MCSETALKIYAAKREGIIKSNALFWRELGNIEKLNGLNLPTEKYKREIAERKINLVCAFDNNFPAVPKNLKPSEKPYLFAYNGDISLLGDRAKNVAVIGSIKPDGVIVERESEIVSRLIWRGFNIVSGLAVGCDTAAHRACLARKGKTVAFLPTTLDTIYPKNNETLACEIVERGGLVVTEYITEAADRFQSIGRFIERDRLQPMFSGSIILVASHLPGQGDSGSRHAMQKAKTYGTKPYVMYNENTDDENPLFGLNRLLAKGGVTVLTSEELNNL